MTYWHVRWDYFSCRQAYHLGNRPLRSDYFQDSFDPDRLKLFFDPEDDRAACDFPYLDAGVFLATSRAAVPMMDRFSRSCRVYAISVQEVPFHVFICHHVMPGFNWERSDCERFKSSGRISRVKRFALQPGFTSDRDVFRLEGDSAISYQVLTSDSFKRDYELNALTGLIFLPVISS